MCSAWDKFHFGAVRVSAMKYVLLYPYSILFSTLFFESMPLTAYFLLLVNSICTKKIAKCVMANAGKYGTI